MPSYVLAHDLGTTDSKATLYDAKGCLTGSVFHGYETEYAHTGWAEQRQAVCASTQTLLQQCAVGCLRDEPVRSGAWHVVQFLRQALSQKARRQLTVEDGWLCFLHGWTQATSRVLYIGIDRAMFDRLGRIAEGVR